MDGLVGEWIMPTCSSCFLSASSARPFRAASFSFARVLRVVLNWSICAWSLLPSFSRTPAHHVGGKSVGQCGWVKEKRERERERERDVCNMYHVVFPLLAFLSVHGVSFNLPLPSPLLLCDDILVS